MTKRSRQLSSNEKDHRSASVIISKSYDGLFHVDVAVILFYENDPLQNAPVYSFQKLIEAAQGNGAATLTLESGETIAPQNVIALR